MHDRMTNPAYEWLVLAIQQNKGREQIQAHICKVHAGRLEVDVGKTLNPVYYKAVNIICGYPPLYKYDNMNMGLEEVNPTCIFEK